MADDRTTRYRPSSFPCPTCQASPELQDLVRAPTGWTWRCRRCNGQTGASLPFDPKTPPDGMAQMYAAIDTLAVYVPILKPIDNDLIYEIVRPYFLAGWCVRDVLHALNYLPTGETQPGQGAAWVRGEDRDRTLWRMGRRLRAWRFSDKDDGHDIMTGPYTASLRAMARLAEKQRDEAERRAREWHARVSASQQATARGAREVARRQASVARHLARQARARAEQQELERRSRDVARARSSAAAREQQAADAAAGHEPQWDGDDRGRPAPPPPARPAD